MKNNMKLNSQMDQLFWSFYLESEKNVISCVCIEKDNFNDFMSDLKQTKYSVLGMHYIESLDLLSAKLLANSRGLMMEWKSNVETLLKSNKNWIVLCLWTDSSILNIWKEKQFYFENHPTQCIEWINTFFSDFERQAVVSQLKMQTDEDVICLVRWSLFSQLGRILKRAQSEGFVVCGLKTTRLQEKTLHRLFKEFHESSRLNLSLEKKLCKFMSVGPVVCIWLKQKNGISKWLSLLSKFKMV